MAYWRPIRPRPSKVPRIQIPTVDWQVPPIREQAIGGFRGLHESVSAAHRPLGALSSVSNLIISPAPALSTRPGLTAVGGQITAGVVRGIHQYVSLDGATVQLLAQAGGTLARWTGSSWTTISSTRPNVPMTGANINDLAVLFWKGYSPQKWDGSSLTALGGSPPQGAYVVEAYEQLFVAGIPSREGDLDFCDVAAPETWTPAPDNDAGSITVSPDPITWLGFAKEQGQVVVWTRYALYVLQGPETPNRPGLWSVETISPYGTPAGRTVKRVGNLWIWLTDGGGRRGFAFWDSGRPEVVSDPIKDSLDLIDWDQIDQATAWTDQEGRYWCSVPGFGGDRWFCWDPDHGWFTGDGPWMRAAGVARFDGQETPVVGDDSGYLYRLGGTTDAGAAIDWSVTIGPSVFSDGFREKQITELRLLVSLAAGASMTAALSLSESGSFGSAKTISAGSDTTKVPVIMPIAPGESTRGDVFRLRLSGSGQVTIHDVLFRYLEGGK